MSVHVDCSHLYRRPSSYTPTVSAFTGSGTLRITNLCRRQAELWENHHSDISLTSLSPHYALALRLGKTLTTDFRIRWLRAMKPKQVPLLNLINGYKYCSCTVSYFFTPFRHRFFPPKLYRRWVLIQIHDWSCHTIDQCQIFHAPQVLNDRPVTTLSTLLTIRNKCPKAGRTIRSSNYQNSISHKRTPLRIFSFAFETKTAGSGTQSCEAMSCHLRLMCYGQSCSEPDKIRACLSPSNQQACDFFFFLGHWV